MPRAARKSTTSRAVVSQDLPNNLGWVSLSIFYLSLRLSLQRMLEVKDDIFVRLGKNRIVGVKQFLDLWLLIELAKHRDQEIFLSGSISVKFFIKSTF